MRSETVMDYYLILTQFGILHEYDYNAILPHLLIKMQSVMAGIEEIDSGRLGDTSDN